MSLVTALSRAVTPDEVADAMFAEGLRAVGADAGSLAFVGQVSSGDVVFRMVRSTGYDDATERRYRVVMPHAGRPLSDAIFSKQLVVIGSVAEWEARYPGQYEENIAPLGIEALAAVPAVVDDRAIACIVFTFHGPRVFDDDARAYLEAIGQVCAQALERARAFESEQRERQRTQMVLSAITDAFIALSPDFRVTFANERAAQLLGRPVESLVGRSLWEMFPGSEHTPFGKLFRDAMERRYAVKREDYSVNLRRWLEARIFPSEDGGLVLFFQDVSGQRRARDASEFLGDASRALASSLDYETTLQNLAQAAVPRIADWCSVDMLQTPGDPAWPPRLRRVALTHNDPARIAIVERLRERTLTDWGASTGLPRVLREGVSDFTPEISDEMMAATATSAEHLEMLREINLRSLIIVPLTARGRLLGALTLGMAESQRRYEDSDLQVAEDLARRAATAIDNALLYVEALDAQRAAERAADRTRRLQTLTASLARAFSEDEVLDIIVDQGIVAIGAQAGVVMLPSADGVFVSPARSVGLSDEVVARLRSLRADARIPARDALKGEPVFLASSTEWVARYDPPIWPLAKLHASAVLPLGGGVRPMGVLSIRFAESHYFDADEREFLVALARQCGQGLERARLFAAERAARTEAENANRAKMEFLATMSHELRTPLNAIGGYAELLEMGVRGAVSEIQKHDLRRIQRNQQQLLSLINDVLNFAKIEAGKVEIDAGPIDVRRTLDAMEPLLAPQLAAKQLTLHSANGSDAVIALADEDKLRQVLLNLLSNAVKFTPDGGQISLSCGERDDRVHLAVRDTGIGIASEYLDRIFDPFVQLERRLTNVVSGTGLGLAISRDLARAMGGNITVESEPGRGSTFLVTLPAAR